MKKKILLRTLIPLTTVGISLGTALPLISCSCNSNGGDQPIVSGYLIDGSNWQGCIAGKLTFVRNTTNHTVSYIGYSVDYAATDLVIPDTVCDVDGIIYTVTTIGNTAFQNCDSIAGSLTIDNSVTVIGDNAFYGCYRLTSLIVGNNITNIGQRAFYGCTNLIDTSNSIVANKISQSGDNVYYIDNGTVSYCIGRYNEIGVTGASPSGTLNLLPNTRIIGVSAFYSCTGLTSNLTIPNSVVTIRNGAFNLCSGFTGNLTIGSGVTKVDPGAFNSCSGFTSIVANFNSMPQIYYNTFRGWATSGSPCTVKSNSGLYTNQQLRDLFVNNCELPSNWVAAT